MRVYVARQPIFNSDGTLFGYELLYRDSDINSYNKDVDGSMATRAVISDAVVAFGLNNLTHGKYAFINFTKTLLMSGFPYLLDPEDFVIEILENTTVDEALLTRLDDLKKKKYLLAMDDYSGEEELEDIVNRSDIIKVDFKLTTQKQRSEIAQKYRNHKRLLAEKVETKEELKQARIDGYTLFQGYYFAKPTLFSKGSTDITSTTYMRIMREITQATPDFGKLADIIRVDVNMTYKLLHRMNTLEYYRSHRVKSIKHALVRMGLSEIRRWMLLILLRDAVSKREDESIRIALVRGVFAQKMAEEIGCSEYSEEAFITGMFSMIDIILEENLPEVLDELCICDEIKFALLGKPSVLTDLLDFVKRYEMGDWDNITDFMKKYKVKKNKLSILYLESINYADLAFDDTSTILSKKNPHHEYQY